MTLTLCIPFVDPTNSNIFIKIIAWFLVTTETANSLVIVIMHIFLVTKLKQS